MLAVQALAVVGGLGASLTEAVLRERRMLKSGTVLLMGCLLAAAASAGQIKKVKIKDAGFLLGTVIEGDGEYLIDNGFAVAWEPSLEWEMTRARRKIRSFLFSDQLLLRFSGKGRVWLQSRSPRSCVPRSQTSSAHSTLGCPRRPCIGASRRTSRRRRRRLGGL